MQPQPSKTVRYCARATIYGILISCCLYGSGRLYFYGTAGFTLSHITPQQEEWGAVTSAPSSEVATALAQPFHYLGKGCQSYVFVSQDGHYVIKFLKYQRFRPSWLLETFSPWLQTAYQKKKEEKKEKLQALLNSWQLADRSLRDQTALLYVHTTPTHIPSIETLSLVDKMGFVRKVNPQQLVFLLQRRATPLCTYIHQEMAAKRPESVYLLFDNLLSMLTHEYQQGIGDNDHALMQNTGVWHNHPIHIDVGQFTQEERFLDPHIAHEELFSKTYKFRLWLAKRYPQLESYLHTQLKTLIGPRIDTLRPKLKTIDEVE